MPDEKRTTNQPVSDAVNSYIMKKEPSVQERLMIIRFTASDVFQDVEEKIYHGMPTFFMVGGKNIMCYAAHKNHISIHLGYEWKMNGQARGSDILDYLKNNYPQYGYTKSTIQFLHKVHLPQAFIQEICEMLWEDRL